MVKKVLNYKFKSSYICKISWNIWTNAFFNWNLIEINFLQKAKNHNYDNLAIEALVYMNNVRHNSYCRNPIIAVVICWFQNKCTRYLLSSYISQCDSGILQWWLGHCWRSDGFWRRWIVDCGLGFWGWGGCCPLFCCNSCFL